MEFFNWVWEQFLGWVRGFFGLDIILKAVEAGNPIPIQGYVQVVFSSVTALLAILQVYSFVYIIVGLFHKGRTYSSQPKDKRYGVIISAWNEEAVIADAIRSVKEQIDYPVELIDVYVACDNCTDRTAEIARSLGAHVYEITEQHPRRKGNALQILFRKMAEEMDLVESHYAYTILDADSVFCTDFFARMNDCLQEQGYDLVGAYRNAKNLGENPITALAGVQVYRNIAQSGRARSVFNTPTEVPGPGSTFRSYLLKDGWNYTQLTEDAEALFDVLCRQNLKTGFCEAAQVYCEFPNTFKLFFRQQMRWAKGRLMVYFAQMGMRIKSFFKKPTWGKYDLFWYIFPQQIFSFYWGLTYQLISLGLFLALGPGFYSWASFGNYFLTTVVTTYISSFVMDVIVIIREWKKVMLSFPRTMAYLFLFPLYNIFAIPLSAISIFGFTTWRKIDHHVEQSGKSLDEFQAKKNKKKTENKTGK